jgi:leucine-rich repeat protein SHOC2
MRAYNIQEAQQKAEQLTYLFLRQLKVTQLMELLPRLYQLKTLDLADNQLEELPDQLGALPELEHLILSNNHLKTLPRFLPPRLKKLELGSNLLVSFPEVLQRLSQLEWLDLSGNRLTHLPEGVKKLKNLQHLFLQKNILQELSGALGQLKQLKTLHLEGNRLTELPSFSPLKKLEKLDLSHNQLRRLPSGLRNGAQLFDLNVSQNRIQKLPGGLFQLNFLRNLDLSNNSLSSLPGRIRQLSWLAHLNLNHNQLKRLPSGLGECSQLQSLTVANNRLSNLPNALNQLEKLQGLNVDHNQLKRLPRLPSSLKELSAAHNEFTQFPSSLHQLEPLEKLNLSGNPIKKWPRTVKKLTSLRYLEMNKEPEDFMLSSYLHLPPVNNIVCDRLNDDQLALLVDILEIAAKVKLPFEQKKALFFDESVGKKLSVSLLLKILNQAGPHLSYAIRKRLIEEKEGGIDLPKSSSISLIGQPLLGIEGLRQQLDSLDVGIEIEAPTPYCFLLGEPPYPKLPDAYFQSLPWLNMRQVLDFIHQKNGSTLSEEQSLTIERLIKSDYPAQQKLGVQLIYGVGMDDRLWEFLYRMVEKKTEWLLQEELLSLLKAYAREEQRKLMAVNIGVS